MEPLPSAIQTYFDTPTARLLAQAAPLTLLAGCLDLLRDTAHGSDAGDAATRTQQISARLTAGDPPFARAATTALVAAGPMLAQALPTQGRAALVAGLAQGMQQAGGSLAALAASFAAALNDPQANWAALHAEVQQAAGTTQTLDVGEDAVVERSGQSVTGASGSSAQTLRVAARGRVSDSSQQISGNAAVPRAPAHATSDPSHRARLIATHTRRLHELEARAALEGTSTPPQVRIEIEDIRRELARLHT